MSTIAQQPVSCVFSTNVELCEIRARGVLRHWHVISLLALFFVLLGKPVPHGNESIYLTMLLRHWNEGFLDNDWLFSQAHPEHFVFNSIFGSLALVVPMGVIAWVGRIASWTLTVLALLRLGQRVGLSARAMSVAIALWVVYRQSIVAGEFVLGGFEAKSFAYVLMIHALVMFCDQRHRAGAACLGVAFSFHPVIGMWSALAAGLALLVNRTPIRQVAEVVGMTFACSLPGLIPIVLMAGASSAGSVGDARWLALVHMPFHLDPLSWSKADLLLSAMMMAFCVVHGRQRMNRSHFRFLLAFESALCLFFLVGVAWRVGGVYSLIRLMPFRLFGVLISLFFLMHVMHAVFHIEKVRSSRAMMALGVLAVVCLGNPIESAWGQIKSTMQLWASPHDSLGNAMVWVARHTERDCVVILPPWRKDSYALAKRAQVATWEFVPYGEIGEFRERIEDLIGTKWQVFDGRGVPQLMEDAYRQLSGEQVKRLALKYGAAYFVSNQSYQFEVVHRTGDYRIYRCGT